MFFLLEGSTLVMKMKKEPNKNGAGSQSVGLRTRSPAKRLMDGQVSTILKKCLLYNNQCISETSFLLIFEYTHGGIILH